MQPKRGMASIHGGGSYRRPRRRSIGRYGIEDRSNFLVGLDLCRLLYWNAVFQGECLDRWLVQKFTPTGWLVGLGEYRYNFVVVEYQPLEG